MLGDAVGADEERRLDIVARAAAAVVDAVMDERDLVGESAADLDAEREILALRRAGVPDRAHEDEPGARRPWGNGPGQEEAAQADGRVWLARGELADEAQRDDGRRDGPAEHAPPAERPAVDRAVKIQLVDALREFFERLVGEGLALRPRGLGDLLAPAELGQVGQPIAAVRERAVQVIEDLRVRPLHAQRPQEVEPQHRADDRQQDDKRDRPPEVPEVRDKVREDERYDQGEEDAHDPAHAQPDQHPARQVAEPVTQTSKVAGHSTPSIHRRERP